jgi:hypothetical protein
MREQVGLARAVQRQRFGADNATLNSRMSTRQLRRHCGLDEEGRGLLRAAMDELGLSARAHDRILRVARTIADLEGAADLRAAHVVEAIGYPSLDGKLWQRSAGATGTGPGGLVGRRPKKQGSAALVRGRRGLPGGSSLARLLRAHRGLSRTAWPAAATGPARGPEVPLH